MNRPVRRVLFVCTGNLCRSPIAQGLLEARARARGAPLIVDSAGTHARVGDPPAPFAIEAAAHYGADIAGQRSRPLAPDDFTRFDWLVALDLSHLDFLHGVRPALATGDVRLLLARMARGGDAEVPDPYGGTRTEFDYATRLIALGVDSLLEEILSARGR